MDEELQLAMAAASSECSSGCQSGWATYLDDDHSSYSYYSCGSARFHAKAPPQQPYSYCCEYSEEEEDDLSMISDASSGPRHQSSAGNDAEAANAEGRRGRREEAAAARRQGKRAAAAAAAASLSLLEDTASSPAFFGYSSKGARAPQAASFGGEATSDGCGGADAEMTGISSAADFSYAFSTTTGFKSPLNLGGYVQMQCSPAPVKPMPTRQVMRRDASEKKKRW